MMNNKIKILTASALFLSTLFSFSCSIAYDSTNVKSKQWTPATHKVDYDPDSCISAPSTKAIFVVGFGSTGGWQRSSCPRGYIAHGQRVRVDIGANSGAYQWVTRCCKTIVTY